MDEQAAKQAIRLPGPLHKSESMLLSLWVEG